MVLLRMKSRSFHRSLAILLALLFSHYVRVIALLQPVPPNAVSMPGDSGSAERNPLFTGTRSGGPSGTVAPGQGTPSAPEAGSGGLPASKSIPPDTASTPGDSGSDTNSEVKEFKIGQKGFVTPGRFISESIAKERKKRNVKTSGKGHVVYIADILPDDKLIVNMITHNRPLDQEELFDDLEKYVPKRKSEKEEYIPDDERKKEGSEADEKGYISLSQAVVHRTRVKWLETSEDKMMTPQKVLELNEKSKVNGLYKLDEAQVSRGEWESKNKKKVGSSSGAGSRASGSQRPRGNPSGN